MATDMQFRTHRPGDIGYIIHRHGVLYSELCGWGTQFEGWVAQIMASFVADHDPELERCWIAERDGRFQGSVVVCRAGGAAPDTARIRVLLVEPEARGLGLGRKLSQMCVDFARDRGFAKVTLVTQSNLTAARAIYSSMGFTCVRRAPSEHFQSADSQEETWELQL
ncbi:MarR family transcriptional regulator [Cordyceps javanica]|uniref:MarR family transcriptional regulator n=1 Tax=Cordyceps javanica TaxID=43265 RepID=A0A545UZE0_9HYPO|nr:MarR family transcriptional regulator [Cordyceps javanica]TQW06709.1 MarR family transcriptional regulator [Cordyceps javanica]